MVYFGIKCLSRIDLDAEDFSNMDKCFHKIKVPFKKEFKKVVHNNYIQKTKDKLSKLTDNSKLYLYNKIKHDIVLEEYLIQDFFFKNRQLNQQPRNLLIDTFENKCPSFTNMSPMNRLDYIHNPTSDLLSVVCTFIKQSLDLRR